MLNKNYPGNESFTITLTDLWYFSSLLIINISLKKHQNTGGFAKSWNDRGVRLKRGSDKWASSVVLSELKSFLNSEKHSREMLSRD